MSQDGGARPKGKPLGSSESHPGAEWKAKSSSGCYEGQSLSALDRAGDRGGVEPPMGRSVGRSLRQKLQAAVGQCFPLQSAPRSPDLSSQRKIHLRELMLDTCPFPPNSGLARTWNILKQHTAPVSEQEALGGPLAACENEDDPLRGSHRLSIEQGVDFPSDPWIHGFGAGALGKPRPKLDQGTDEPVGLAEGEGQEEEEEEQEATAACPALPDAPRAHTQVDYIHCLVPDLLQLTQLPCYWGVMDRYQAEALLEGKAEGTFLLRDSAQEDYLFSVSFRRYGRSLHARIEQWNHQFSFDVHDPSVFHAPTVTGLLEHYKDPSACMFFEPLLALPVNRTFPFGLQQLCRAAVGGRTTYDGIGRLPIPSALKEYLKEYHYKQRVRVRRLDTWWS